MPHWLPASALAQAPVSFWVIQFAVSISSRPPNMADTLKPLPAAGLHIRRVDPSRHKFQAAVSHDGLVLYIPNVPFLVKNFKAWVHRLYNRWRTALWPAPPALAIGGTMAFAAWVLTRPAGSWLRSGYLATAIWNLDTIFLWTQLLPTPLRVAYLSTISAGVVGILLTEYQKRFLRLVLSYQGWLFEEPKKPSLFTKAWLGFIKYCYVKTSRPLLYSYQDSLPRLPVPSLKVWSCLLFGLFSMGSCKEGNLPFPAC